MKSSTIMLALLTLTAFAANSILCRQALRTESIGPAAFTAIRLGSGIISLAVLFGVMRQWFRSSLGDAAGGPSVFRPTAANVGAPVALFGYAVFFSLAYVQLSAGAGALILFASVQITMMGWSIVHGERVSIFEWTGLAVAFAGLIYFLVPGLTAPPAMGTTMMILAGVSWGAYSLLGRNQRRPIAATARNFLFCLPGVVILGLAAIFGESSAASSAPSREGILLAAISGAMASGVGYVLWYLTVRRITITVASVVQLAVPVLAALGGIVFLGERLTLRLIIASILIIGGIVLAVVGRRVLPRSNVSEEADGALLRTPGQQHGVVGRDCFD